MPSDITINSLKATAGLGQIVLSAAWNAAGGRVGLPYAEAAKVEFWGGTSNDLDSASKVGESGAAGIYVHGDLSDGATWYYWARAVDPQGNFGQYSSGISATTKSAALGPDSVGSDELQNGAVNTEHFGSITVTNAQISDLSASKITGGTINATISINGPTITGGTIKTRNSGDRVELSQSDNDLLVYDGGFQIARLGGGNSIVLDIDTGPRAARFISVDPSSTIETRNFGSGPGLDAEAMGSGGNSHGIRAFGGGSGAMGTSNAIGGYAFYSVDGGYGPFTGAHDALIAKDAEPEIGDIVVSTGRVLAKKGVDDVLLEVARCGDVGQRGAFGIVTKSQDLHTHAGFAALPKVHQDQPATPIRLWLAERYQRLKVNGVGEGRIAVCGRGGDLEVGDLIVTSDLPGKGQRIDMEAPATVAGMASVVAQAMQPVAFEGPDQVKLVACVYRCG